MWSPARTYSMGHRLRWSVMGWRQWTIAWNYSRGITRVFGLYSRTMSRNSPERERKAAGASSERHFRGKDKRSIRNRESRGDEQGMGKPLGCLRSAQIVYDLHEFTTRIGRGRSSDIVLDTSKSISSKHAIVSISQDGGSATLKDLNSLNGTFINNVRVHNETHPLESRDLVKFGCDVVSYRFELAKDMREFSPKQRGKENQGVGARSSSSRGGRLEEADIARRRPQTAKEFCDNGSDGDNERASTNMERNRHGDRERFPGRDSRDGAPSYMGSPHPGLRSGSLSPSRGKFGEDLDVEERRLLARERAIDLAHQQGERLGKWAAEFDEMKRRLKDVESRGATTRSFRESARVRLREQRSRHRSRSRERASGGSGSDRPPSPDDEDADLLMYEGAEGVVKQRSPHREKSLPIRRPREAKDMIGDNEDIDAHAPSVSLREDGLDRIRANEEREKWDGEISRKVDGSYSKSRSFQGHSDRDRRNKSSMPVVEGGDHRRKPVLAKSHSLHRSSDSLKRGNDIDSPNHIRQNGHGGSHKSLPKEGSNSFAKQSIVLADSLDDTQDNTGTQRNMKSETTPLPRTVASSDKLANSTAPLNTPQKAQGIKNTMGRPLGDYDEGQFDPQGNGEYLELFDPLAEGGGGDQAFPPGGGGDQELPPAAHSDGEGLLERRRRNANKSLGKISNIDHGDESMEAEVVDLFSMANGGGDETMAPSSDEEEYRSVRGIQKFKSSPHHPVPKMEEVGDQEDGYPFKVDHGDEAMPPLPGAVYEGSAVDVNNVRKITRTNNSSPDVTVGVMRVEAGGGKHKSSKSVSAEKTGGTMVVEDNDHRVATLLSQVSKLRVKLKQTETELAIAKNQNLDFSSSDSLLSSARRAAMRPIIKTWRFTRLATGFTGFRSNLTEAKEKEASVNVLQKRKSSALAKLFKAIKYIMQRELASAVRKWQVGMTRKFHVLDKEAAITNALALSEDKAKARGLGQYCRELQERLEEAIDANRLQAETLEELEGLDWPRKILEQKRTVRQLYTQVNEVREQAEAERENFARALREIKTAGPSSAKAQIQNFITAQSRQVMLAKQQIQEYERRHEASAKAWVEMEQEKETLISDIEYLRRESLEQAVSWRDMLGARDKRLVYLEDKLASLAGYGDAAKTAAAQVLVRELHDMRRETADFAEKMQRQVERTRAAASVSEQKEQKSGKGVRFGGVAGSNARDTVMESRVLQLQNELRQLNEEGSVAHVVRCQEAARMARVDAAAQMTKADGLREEIKLLRKEMSRMVDPNFAVRVEDTDLDVEDGNEGLP